jgi:hypothetical protein
MLNLSVTRKSINFTQIKYFATTGSKYVAHNLCVYSQPMHNKYQHSWPQAKSVKYYKVWLDVCVSLILRNCVKNKIRNGEETWRKGTSTTSLDCSSHRNRRHVTPYYAVTINNAQTLWKCLYSCPPIIWHTNGSHTPPRCT